MHINLDLLSAILQNENGNVIEIGAGEGFNTRALCSLEFVEKVIVIDPFENCWDDPDIDNSYTRPYPLQNWINTIGEFGKKVILVQKRSDDSDVFGILNKISNFIFCFVDGIQRKENIINDLLLCDSLKVKTICLDDWSRVSDISQVKEGTMEFLKNNSKYEILANTEHNIGTGSVRDLCFLRRKEN